MTSTEFQDPLVQEPDRAGGPLGVLVCGATAAARTALINRLTATSAPDAGVPSTAGPALRLEPGPSSRRAVRRFNSTRRSYRLVDAGELQDAAGLVAAASECDIAIVLMDASPAFSQGAHRPIVLCALLGIRDVVAAVDGAYRQGSDSAEQERQEHELRAFGAKAGLASLTPVPLSIERNENIAAKSQALPSSRARTLVDALDWVLPAAVGDEAPFRFLVREVAGSDGPSQRVAGEVLSGMARAGEEIVLAVSGRRARIAEVTRHGREPGEARRGQATTLVLEPDVGAAAGDVIAHATRRPEVSDQFAAHVLWTGEEHMLPGRSYLLRMGTRETPASVTAIKHRIDVDSMQHLAARNLHRDEIGFCNLATAAPLAFDSFAENRPTGSFTLVDRISTATVGAGIVSFGLRRATNIHVEELIVDKPARALAKLQQPTVIWFTGLSGSGKSTIAKRLEKQLHDAGKHTYVLDGDNVRHGLNRDLGFTDADRVENIRRIGEVAKLFADAGIIVLCSFISPFRTERRMVRELLSQGEFVEVFVDASIDECRRRDPKGLYAKADAGKIKNFTGIDSPYEPPEQPDLHLITEGVEPDFLVGQIVAHLRAGGRI